MGNNFFYAYRSEIEMHAATCEGISVQSNTHFSRRRHPSPADQVRNPGNGSAASADTFPTTPQEDEQLCPICSETYPPDIIQRHAARCGEVYV